MTRLAWVVALVLTGVPLAFAAPSEQTEDDEYTRYELLEPDSGAFRITYEVSATTPGATSYFNPIRKGSVASDEAVYDRLTGKPLAFEIVPGGGARAGGVSDAAPDTSYIQLTLVRPVPAEGETRLLILKTSRDPKSYWREGDTIVFSRSLSIKRNAIVLPAGYELVACNMPAQVLADPDGRLLVSFMSTGPAEAPLLLKARKLRR